MQLQTGLDVPTNTPVLTGVSSSPLPTISFLLREVMAGSTWQGSVHSHLFSLQTMDLNPRRSRKTTPQMLMPVLIEDFCVRKKHTEQGLPKKPF